MVFAPDAIVIAGTIDLSSGAAVGFEKGGLVILRGKDAGLYNYNDLGAGLGGLSVAVGVEFVKLYTSAANVLKSHFYGPRFEAAASGTIAFVSVGVTSIYADHAQGFTIGIGATLALDAMPFNFNINVNRGTTTESFYELSPAFKDALYSW